MLPGFTQSGTSFGDKQPPRSLPCLKRLEANNIMRFLNSTVIVFTIINAGKKGVAETEE